MGGIHRPTGDIAGGLIGARGMASMRFDARQKEFDWA
jgi:hypothetical protein